MLHPRILCALEDKLARPLTHIFNYSVETGIMPEDWKSANVTAIHKKRSTKEPENYRLEMYRVFASADNPHCFNIRIHIRIRGCG